MERSFDIDFATCRPTKLHQAAVNFVTKTLGASFTSAVQTFMSLGEAASACSAGQPILLHHAPDSITAAIQQLDALQAAAANPVARMSLGQDQVQKTPLCIL